MSTSDTAVRHAFLGWLSFVSAVLCATSVLAAPPDYPAVLPGTQLVFPRDHGAHPQFRQEWWYVTGWLETETGKSLGFQVTFFRSRPQTDQANPSRFAPKQLLFAHVALSDPAQGRLLHDQRAARSGFGLAQAAESDTDVRIDEWTLRRDSSGSYMTKIAAREFTLQLDMQPTQPLLLQGERGYSRKGAAATQASYYYSQPQLRVSGTVERDGRRVAVLGTAWLDHEWSTSVLAKEAVGWDWVGLNFDDGGALMAFRIRDAARRTLWAAGTLRGKDGVSRVLNKDEVSFAPTQCWRSPHTGAEYPVAMRLQAGEIKLDLEPLMPDQELDSRMSTGAVYWEGAVSALRDGVKVGRGYLELTGYFKPLKF